MAINELQLALIGAGAAGVALVWGYNVWQDRKHRKAAERIFTGGPGDALIPADAAAPVASDDERREPVLAPAAEIRPEPQAEAEAEVPPQESPPPSPAQGGAPAPALPAEWADPVADCIVRLSAPDPLPAPAVRALQASWSGELGKSLRWLARADEGWRPVDAEEQGQYREWAAALQLVDRRGPVSDGELGRFFDGMQQLAQQAGASLELPSRGEMAIRAGKLDDFCAGVDIQFVLHIVEASGGVFAGSKLRGVAEAAGLQLEGDGVFRLRDAAGAELFTVANMGTERLDAESIRSLATHGLTLSLDVPRVANGVTAFDRMLATAQQITLSLGGVLVDAQRAPLSDVMIAAIRAKTAELQRRLSDADIVPGSARALRLFS